MESVCKRQKRDFEVIMLEDLPVEIILKIFSHLPLKDLFNCMVLSKRIRNIAHDDTLWEKLNLVQNFKLMPVTLFPQILAKGCKYLSVDSCCTSSTGESLSFENNYKLKYLSVIRPSEKFVIKVLPDLMASFFGLEKLSIRPGFGMKPLMFGNTNIYSNFFKCIIQNSKTLRVLDLGVVDLNLESVKHIFTLCQELTELNLNFLNYKSMDFLCKNLTNKIEKIDIGSDLRPDQLKVLLRRCNKISELSINCTCLSDDSVSTIIENLSQSLVKLDIDMAGFSVSNILELAAMPKLQVLCDPLISEHLSDEDKNRIEKRLPAHLKTHLTDKLNIAVPYPNTYMEIIPEKKKLGYDYPGDYDKSIFNQDKFWEIKARPRVYQVNSYDYLEKFQKEDEENARLKL